MKPELRRMVEEHFHIPHPETKKHIPQDPTKGQLNAQDSQQKAILLENAKFKSFPEAKKQEIRWHQGNKSDDLKAKADEIVAKQNGKEIFAAYLADQNDIFVNYIFGALNKAGYVQTKTKLGAPSIGIDYLYRIPEPILCPHCKKELGPGFFKK